MFVEIMQPVNRIAQSERLVRAQEKLTLVLIEHGRLIETLVGSLAAVKILLDVLVYGKTTTADELVE